MIDSDRPLGPVIAILDVFLERAVPLKATDPAEAVLESVSEPILESSDIISRLFKTKDADGIVGVVAQTIREHEQAIEEEHVGSSRLVYLAATLGLQRFEERCVVLALAPELNAKYSELYAYLPDSVTRSHPTVDFALQLFSTMP